MVANSLTKEILDKETTMVRKSNMSKTKGKTQISPETKIYVDAVNKVISERKMLRVKRMKDLQTMKNVKDKEARDEEKDVESPESDCEILEISEGDGSSSRTGSGAVKRQSESENHSDSDGKVRRVDRGRVGDSFEASRRRASLAQQPSLSSVQVLGVDLLYRPSSSAILFSTDSVLALLGASLPLDQHSLHSVVPGGKQVSDGGVHFYTSKYIKYIKWMFCYSYTTKTLTPATRILSECVSVCQRVIQPVLRDHKILSGRYNGDLQIKLQCPRDD